MYVFTDPISPFEGDVETGKKLHHFPGKRTFQKGMEGHIGEVLAVTVSSDGKFLASAGKDRFVRIWDAHNNKLLESFKGHRDVVGVRLLYIQS
jgi:ribosomal RNA-processing protein 9